jgi:hypothetical protein
MKALLKASLNPSIGEFPAAYGHLVLRVAAGLMIFYVHGWHKLEGWIAYLEHGTTWKLAEEVEGCDRIAKALGIRLAKLFEF